MTLHVASITPSDWSSIVDLTGDRQDQRPESSLTIPGGSTLSAYMILIQRLSDEDLLPLEIEMQMSTPPLVDATVATDRVA